MKQEGKATAQEQLRAAAAAIKFEVTMVGDNNKEEDVVMTDDGNLEVGLYVETREETIKKTRDLCRAIAVEFRSIQFAYVLNIRYPVHGLRDNVKKILHELLQEIHLLKSCPARFDSLIEYYDFESKIRKLVKGTMKIIKLTRDHVDTGFALQKNALDEVIQEAHPKYDPTLKPWSQFLAPNAPSLIAANFLPPFAVQPPEYLNYPDHFKIHLTTVQALPQGGMTMMVCWMREFESMIRIIRQALPWDPYYRESIQNIMYALWEPKESFSGLMAETFQLHDFGPIFYGRRMAWMPQDERRETLSRFLGQLEALNVRGPIVANRAYVMRAWIMRA